MTSFSDAAALAVKEWEQAWRWDEQLQQWRDAHPDAKYHEEEAWRVSEGIPDILSAGRLHVQSRRTGERWWTLKLRQPTEHGRYLLECRQCRKVAFVDHVMQGSGLCGSCRAEQLVERKVEQAQRRVERRRQRSAELANRKGRCLVCGAEMLVARITKTTCSDRCRKQWIRKGAEAFPLPTTPTHCQVSDTETMPLEEVAQKLWGKYIERSMSLAMSGQDRNADERLPQLKAEAEKFERLALLAELREKSPAIYLWELSQ
jgi:hypothetical protein